jgi:hypothetical protein
MPENGQLHVAADSTSVPMDGLERRSGCASDEKISCLHSFSPQPATIPTETSRLLYRHCLHKVTDAS